MTMAHGQDNLISLADRATEEQREIARMGGVASGVVRKAKASIKKLLPEALAEKIPNSNITYADSIVLALLTKAANGDIKAIRLIIEAIDGMEQKIDHTSSDGSMSPKATKIDLSSFTPEQLIEMGRAAFRGE